MDIGVDSGPSEDDTCRSNSTLIHIFDLLMELINSARL